MPASGSPTLNGIVAKKTKFEQETLKPGAMQTEKFGSQKAMIRILLSWLHGFLLTHALSGWGKAPLK
jgi:hypothetical protein